MFIRQYTKRGNFKSYPPSYNGLPYPDYLIDVDDSRNKSSLTPSKAQLFASQHFQDAIMSLELAEEFFLSSKEGAGIIKHIQTLRDASACLLALCNSAEGSAFFKKHYNPLV